MELAVHQSLTELTSDWSKRQSCGELINRKILISAAKIINLQWLIELLRILVNGMQTKATGQCLAAHWNLLETVRRVPETRTRYYLLVK
jgi:hypothetical protein